METSLLRNHLRMVLPLRGNVSVVGYNKQRLPPGQVDSFNMLPAPAEVGTNSIVYLLSIYDKSEKENLTDKELDEWQKNIPE